jgi:hypothetical protein
MSAYSRDPKATPRASAEASRNEQGAQGPQEAPIPVDGFQQVLEMLRIADPAFRESLLRRLAARDARLARELRADLEN